MAEVMSTQGEDSVIHRKAQVARDGFDAREMSPAKALRLALAKTADALLGLVVKVRMVEQTRIDHAVLEETLGEDGLLILLDGPEQTRGALRFDLQCVAALIEVQLMGQVQTGEAMARPFTQTDAAITQPLINGMLEAFDLSLDEAGITGCVSGLRFGDRVEDGRAISLALSAPNFEHFRLSLDFGDGAKTGLLDLILPHQPRDSESETEADAAAMSARLEQNALNAPVTLNATLGRMRLPLHDVCDWAPGTVLPLSLETFNEGHLLGAGGHQIATVKLGQLNGFRAVLLLGDAAQHTPTDPSAGRANRPAVAPARTTAPTIEGTATPVSEAPQESPAPLAMSDPHLGSEVEMGLHGTEVAGLSPADTPAEDQSHTDIASPQVPAPAE